MDNFKQVNDRCGHPYGDTVLTWAAERLRHFFRSGDIIGRIGGDEFMIFLKNVPDTALVEKRCQGLLQAMSSLLDGREGAVKLSCSLGRRPGAGARRAFQELFQRADNALYQAKALGKNGYVIYSGETPGLLRQPSAAGTRIESDRREGGGPGGAAALHPALPLRQRGPGAGGAAGAGSRGPGDPREPGLYL